MMSAFFHFQHTLNRFFNNYILVLDKFVLKYEIWSGAGGVELPTPPPPPGKTTFKKVSLIRVKMTDVELDHFTDIDQHLFIKEGISGGVAMISHQYAWDNAPDIKNYDTRKRNSYIIYLDAKNLYGCAMSQPLLTSNFEWLTDKKMGELDVMKVSDDS